MSWKLRCTYLLALARGSKHWSSSRRTQSHRLVHMPNMVRTCALWLPANRLEFVPIGSHMFTISPFCCVGWVLFGQMQAKNDRNLLRSRGQGVFGISTDNMGASEKQ